MGAAPRDLSNDVTLTYKRKKLRRKCSKQGRQVTDWEWASTISAEQNHLGELCLPIFEDSG
ncbi:MAG: hypothetical protein GY822_32250 [Deltaproteobacteria bacterium]|nr:hypothetical protein [Deltaproteobacteria bacterium]